MEHKGKLAGGAGGMGLLLLFLMNGVQDNGVGVAVNATKIDFADGDLTSLTETVVDMDGRIDVVETSVARIEKRGSSSAAAGTSPRGGPPVEGARTPEQERRKGMLDRLRQKHAPPDDDDDSGAVEVETPTPEADDDDDSGGS